MDIDQLLSQITPEKMVQLNYAVETGRWLEGERLTESQRDTIMQVLMIHQSRHNINAQHMTVEVGGAISIKSKSELKSLFSADDDCIFPLSLK